MASEGHSSGNYAVTNRLAGEASPYLRLHAHQPVDWWPWSDEALARAVEKDRPVFLSIGYSACHWCHVMSRECFDDEEVAAELNAHFVPIKVDREERPDLDAIYMEACQQSSGSCGWPLTALLTPDLKPFFIGTYFPKQSRYGRPGLMDVLKRAREFWTNRRKDLEESAAALTQRLRDTEVSRLSAALPADIAERTEQTIRDRYDDLCGGFGPPPKFLVPQTLMFLTRVYRQTRSLATLAMVEGTLKQMLNGGVYDQVGGGFHRYAVDRQWRVPHFEKMLYDQALMAMAFSECYLVTGRGHHARAGQAVIEFMLREMMSPDGTFYSSIGSESEGAEGRYYTWTREELLAEIEPEDAQLMELVYGTSSPDVTLVDSRIVLRRDMPLANLSREIGQPVDEIVRRLTAVEKRLRTARARRPQPMRDEKILTDWNGLAVAALAVGGRCFSRADFTEAARRCAETILDSALRADGRLCHMVPQGRKPVDGFLDDYAYLIWGLLELHQTCLGASYGEVAKRLLDVSVQWFWDGATAGFFHAPSDRTGLIARTKPVFDGAMPSGNSVQLANLVRIGRLYSEDRYSTLAHSLLASFAPRVLQVPWAYTGFLWAHSVLSARPVSVTIVGPPDHPDTARMLGVVHGQYRAEWTVRFVDSSKTTPPIPTRPDVQQLVMSQGRPTAYVCFEETCRPPVVTPEALADLLEQA